MEFLMRDGVALSDKVWEAIDSAVVKAAKGTLTGRRFLPLYGPLGAGVQNVSVDTYACAEAAAPDFFGDNDDEPVQITGRQFAPLPVLFKDFVLSWRDLEEAKMFDRLPDMGVVSAAATFCAQKEEQMIYLGCGKAGCEGLANASGALKLKKGDWSKDESAFADIVKGLQHFTAKNISGRYALVVSPDLYAQLQHLQPGTGVLESERIKALVGNIFVTPVLGAGKAVLVCPEAQNMDLAVGQDYVTGYLGSEKLNHLFRIMETARLRIKRADAIVIYG